MYTTLNAGENDCFQIFEKALDNVDDPVSPHRVCTF